MPVTAKKNAKRLPKEQRRRQILEVALALFAEKGYRNTTTAAIAAHVGVAEPVLYQHFEGKKDILMTLLGGTGVRVVNHWRRITQDVDDPLERISVVALDYPRFRARHANEIRLIDNVISETADPEVKRVLRNNYRAYEKFFVAIFQEAIDRGIARPDLDTRFAAWVVISIGKVIGLVRYVGLQALPGEPFMDFAANRFMRFLCRSNDDGKPFKNCDPPGS
jgi:AcrR family transcriptional regulator